MPPLALCSLFLDHFEFPIIQPEEMNYAFNLIVIKGVNNCVNKNLKEVLPSIFNNIALKCN